MISNVSESMITKVKAYEGFYSAAYKCPAGVWTIGYGHTSGVKEGDRVTQSKAEKLLIDDLSDSVDLLGTVPFRTTLNQYMLDGFASFEFNTGKIGTLIKGRNLGQIFKNFCRYNKVGSTTLSGLVARRRSELKHALQYPGYVIKQGSSHKADVSFVQFCVNAFSDKNIGVDGLFGSSTLAGVKRYQSLHNLTVDGVVGKNTWSDMASNLYNSRLE